MSSSAWGVSWLGSWGNSWGPLHEVEEDTHYSGGGKAHRESLFREHWDYLDGLREIEQSISVTVADELGSRVIEIPLDMPLPDAITPRAMRGNLAASGRTVADVIDDPLAIMALALMLDEVD